MIMQSMPRKQNKVNMPFTQDVADLDLGGALGNDQFVGDGADMVHASAARPLPPAPDSARRGAVAVPAPRHLLLTVLHRRGLSPAAGSAACCLARSHTGRGSCPPATEAHPIYRSQDRGRHR